MGGCMAGTARKSILIASWMLTLVALAGCGGGGGGGDSGGGPTGSDPTVPSGLQCTSVTQAQITLAWDASTDDSVVMGYLVSGGGATPVTAMSTSYSFANLDPGTQYCFSVQAFDDEGHFSGASSALCVTTEATATQPWVTVHEGITDPLTSLVWTGSQLVAIAEAFSSSTTIMTSLDGVDWNSFPSSGFGFNGVERVVHTGKGFLGMNYGFSSATVYTSPDGIAWTMEMGVDPGPGSDFTWSPELSLFVMVGEQGFIGTSLDGSDWTTVNESSDPSPATSVDLYGVRSLGGTLFAVGAEGTILRSGDGSIWTQVNLDDTTLHLSDIAWNGEIGPDALYVAVGYSSAFTSSDGLTWTKQTGAPGGYNDRIVWGGAPANCFVTIGLNNHLYNSSSGVTWGQRLINDHTSSAQGALYDVVWTGSFFAVAGDKGTILTSPDGADWSIRSSGHTLKGIRYLDNSFVAVGDNGRIAVSSDTENWSYLYAGDDAYYFEDVASGANGTWILPGQTYMLRSHDGLQSFQEDWWGATSTDTAMVWDDARYLWVGDGTILSWDGGSFDAPGEIDWKWSHFGSGDYYEDLHWDGNVYVVVGHSGKILTSGTATAVDAAVNATSWTDRTAASVTTENLYAVTKGPGRHVAVGAAGTVVTSDDGGVTWIRRSSGFANALYDASWTGTDYVAVGYSGAILTSDDGVTWSTYDHGTGNFYGVSTNGVEVVVVGARGQIIHRNAP